jgi:hypothetical protein
VAHPGNASSFQPHDYRLAAAERLETVATLRARGEHGIALYWAGVAAECAIRSRIGAGAAFSGRHNLLELALPTDFLPRASAANESIVASIQTLHRVWRNSFRYMHTEKIARVLEESGFEPQVSKSFRMKRAAEAAEAAAAQLYQRAVNLSVARPQ